MARGRRRRPPATVTLTRLADRDDGDLRQAVQAEVRARATARRGGP